MAKQLILMRHAKSDWSLPGQADQDRPLNERGRRAAPRMAAWLEAQGWQPDRMLVSTATRTQETVMRMREVWDGAAEPVDVPALYLASQETLLRVIEDHGEPGERLLVLAHNPGVEALAGHLSGAPVAFPTAAVAVFDCDIEVWYERLLRQRVTCRAIQRPRELSE